MNVQDYLRIAAVALSCFGTGVFFALLALQHTAGDVVPTIVGWAALLASGILSIVAWRWAR